MFPLFRYKFSRKKQLVLNFVLRPLVEAYDIAKKDNNMVNYDENTITKKLVWYLKKETSLSTFCQKRMIAVEMRPKEHLTIDELCEPDIKFMVGDRLWMEIEAKRIYKKCNWSTSEYLSKDGIGRFLSGKYSENENHGGMIGYIQKGDLQAVIQGIKSGLKTLSCKGCDNVEGINNCLLSIHYRTNKNDIEIYHLFFYFS